MAPGTERVRGAYRVVKTLYSYTTHTLYAQTATNLIWRYLKYAKVARVVFAHERVSCFHMTSLPKFASVDILFIPVAPLARMRHIYI